MNKREVISVCLATVYTGETKKTTLTAGTTISKNRRLTNFLSATCQSTGRSLRKRMFHPKYMKKSFVYIKERKKGIKMGCQNSLLKLNLRRVKINMKLFTLPEIRKSSILKF